MCQQTLRVCYRVALIDHRLVLGLVGLLEELCLSSNFLAVVDQLLNPILSSNRDEGEIFGGSRGDMYAFSYKTSPVFSLTTFGLQ